MALDKHNRLIEGVKLSRKAREESISRESEWAGKIRWYSEIIGEGEAQYYAAKSKLEERKKLDNFRCAHPDVSESEAKRIVRNLSGGDRAGKVVVPVKVATAQKSQHWKEINALKSKLGQLMRKSREGDGNGGATSQQPGKKKFTFECWHCKSTKHPVAICPVAKAGKPPVKGSFFWKQQNDKSGGKP